MQQHAIMIIWKQTLDIEILTESQKRSGFFAKCMIKNLFQLSNITDKRQQGRKQIGEGCFHGKYKYEDKRKNPLNATP